LLGHDEVVLIVVLLLSWLVLLPAGALLCARVLRFGEQPSTPPDAGGVDAAGARLQGVVQTQPVPTH
jgi:hypothetical protein